MRKHWLCLASSDFGRSVTLYQSTDLIDCEAKADSLATDAIADGNEFAYVYELKQVYLPRPKEPTKEVEVVYVD